MRIQPITPGQNPELVALEARIVAERGRISPLYQVLLNSPPIAQGWEQMLSAVRNRSSLPAAVRELVILRVAVLNRAPYEFEAHVPHALKAGLAPALIDKLREPVVDATALDNAAQQAALRLCEAMTRQIEVPDDVYALVQQHFDTQGQLDLVATVAAYNMVSRLLVALHIGH